MALVLFSAEPLPHGRGSHRGVEIRVTAARPDGRESGQGTRGSPGGLPTEAYLPTTTIEKESGSMGARGPRPPFLVASGAGASAGGAGGGPYSAAISST